MAVSLGSFSEAQSVLDPALLVAVFAKLTKDLPAAPGPAGPAGRRWLIQDSSLFAALPRRHLVLWRQQGQPQNPSAPALESGRGPKRPGPRCHHARQDLRVRHLAHALAAGRQLHR